MRPNCRKTVFKFTVPVITFTLILLILELFSRFYAQYFHEPTNNYDFRIKQPAPYQNSPYFSEKFVNESFFEPGKWDLSDEGILIPADFKGRYFSTSGGMRSTSFQPEKSDFTIHLFGGSTMYCGEVPDEYTIASYLQTFFNRNLPGKYIVKNYGVPTLSIAEQVKRLKAAKLRKDDIVIFYDGVNEIFLNLYYANKDSSIVRVAVNNMNTLSWILKIMLYLSENSYFVKLFMNPINYAIPEHLNDKVFMDKMLTETAAKYKKKIAEAYRLSTGRGAHFFHFLQPQFFSDKVLTEYEKNLGRNKYLVIPGSDISFRAGYPVLQTAITQLPKEIQSYDLTHILDKRPDGEEYYLDNVHVNHLANRRIANEIFDKIRTLPDRKFQHPREQRHLISQQKY